MRVRDIMTEKPECCGPETNLREVAEMMVVCDCGEIPICDDRRKPIGVVTDRDVVCRLVAKGKNPLEHSARDCMTSPAITVTPDTAIEDCARLMEQYQVRRLPVVDAGGAICGMVSQADLARKGPRSTTMEVMEKVSEPSVQAGAGR